jgi:hypothetical protein
MLALFQQQCPVPLATPFIVRTPTGARMEFDAGVAASGAQPGLLVEAWAHQGPPKAAQKKKIVGDALKLAYGSSLLDGPTRLVLLFSDPLAAAPFTSTRAWSASAFNHFAIEIGIVELPEDERERIRLAQTRQYR